MCTSVEMTTDQRADAMAHSDVKGSTILQACFNYLPCPFCTFFVIVVEIQGYNFTA